VLTKAFRKLKKYAGLCRFAVARKKNDTSHHLRRLKVLACLPPYPVLAAVGIALSSPLLLLPLASAAKSTMALFCDELFCTLLNRN